MSFDQPLVLIALVARPARSSRSWRLPASAAARRRRPRFSTPALHPEPRRRAGPAAGATSRSALLLLALAALIVGAARPHATRHVPRKEATVVLAIDVSRSMTAQDVQPDPARRRAQRRGRVPREGAEGVQHRASSASARRAFVALPPTTDRVLARDALESLAPSEGTAIGDAVALAVRARHSGSDGRRDACRRRRCSSSPTAPATAAGRRRSPRRARRALRHPRLDRARRHARTASSRTSSSAATRSRSASRRARGRCSRSRSSSGGQFFRARTSAALTASTRSSRRARPQDAEPARSPTSSPAARSCCCSPAARSRRSGSGGPSVRRALVLARRSSAALRRRGRAGGATNECRGLQVCVPVAGPVGRRDAGPGRVPARLPAALHRRRPRRGALEPRASTSGSSARSGARSTRDHDVREAVFLGRFVRGRDRGRDASARTSAACRRPAAASAPRRRTTCSSRASHAARVVDSSVHAGTTTHARAAPATSGSWRDARDRLLRRHAAVRERGPRGRATQRVANGPSCVTGHARRAPHAVVQLDLLCAPR